MPGMNDKILGVLRSRDFDPVLRDMILGWTESDFLVFLDRYAEKVASKLRNAKTVEFQRDVAVELFAARALSAAGCSLVYEPEKGGPDFRCAMRGFEWYCEVKRMREVDYESGKTGHLSAFPPNLERKPGDIVCTAVRQVKPGHPNILYMRSDRFFQQDTDVRNAIDFIMDRSGAGDDAFFRNHRFSGCGDFKSKLSFLSAFVYDVQWIDDPSEGSVMVWRNPETAFPLGEWLVALLKQAFSIPFNEEHGGKDKNAR